MVRGIEVRRVLRTGHRSRHRHLDIHWVPSSVGHSRLGLVVPRAGHTAVARNRLRRRLKELWRRELAAAVGPIDVVFRAHRSSYRAELAELREELRAWSGGLPR